MNGGPPNCVAPLLVVLADIPRSAGGHVVIVLVLHHRHPQTLVEHTDDCLVGDGVAGAVLLAKLQQGNHCRATIVNQCFAIDIFCRQHLDRASNALAPLPCAENVDQMSAPLVAPRTPAAPLMERELVQRQDGVLDECWF